ncbi:MAG TPA: zinc ribbon domain-containing protein [Thermoplasmata archaeon]|nr:zinc ribbon domain-containing protein [Thermoplasmata archaeon]
MEPPEAQTIKSMLHIARILAIVLGVIVLLGGLAYAAWIAYLSSVCSTYIGFDPYCGAAITAALLPAIYLVLWGIVAIVVYMQMKSIESKVNSHQYESAKSQTLIWMILGFIFGIILGVILLIAYLKFDPLITWQRNQGGMPPAYGMPPAAASAPAPMAAGQKFCSSCGAANAAGTAFCSKCGAALAA